uniref:Uncharacterized protein n=1 Tax=Arundo donax TaxID=35708 RepID=A0A0A9GWU0_ARUDO
MCVAAATRRSCQVVVSYAALNSRYCHQKTIEVLLFEIFEKPMVSVCVHPSFRNQKGAFSFASASCSCRQ